MNLNKLLALAIALMAQGFSKRLDRHGKPYILHCIRVMDNVDTIEEKILAILHDGVEDGACSIIQLRELGFPENILDDLKLLTHNKEEDYLGVYIKKIATSQRATNVKKADLKDNSDIGRSKGLSKADLDRIEKYFRAYVYLSQI